MHQNIAGALNKIDYLNFALHELAVSNTHINILCLSETFLQKGCENLLKIDGFKTVTSFSRDREKRGGTCILIEKNLSHIEIDLFKKISCAYTFECCGTYIPGSSLVVICVYRIPNGNIKVFFDKIELLLHYVTTKFINKKVVICGDWNVDFLRQSRQCEQLLSILKNNNLRTHITTATRQNSCIDQIASNITKTTSELPKLGLSDHETAQIVSFRSKVQRTPRHWFEYKRNYSKDNVRKFKEALMALSFSDLYDKRSLNEAFDSFHEILRLFYNLCFPILLTKVSTRISKNMWLSKGLKKSCTTKRQLYFKYKNSGTDKQPNKTTYIKYSHLLKRCIHNSQRIGNIRRIENSKNKCKATWDTINSNITHKTEPNNIDKLICNSKTYSEPEEICQVLNNFFVDIGSNAANTNSNVCKGFSSNVNSIFLLPTDAGEVLNVIKNLNNSKAVGYDGINTKILKICAVTICQPLSYLINMSLEEGTFPKSLKKSIVKPIHKKGDPTEMNNYRPVTLIPILSKVFEKIMYKRLNEFVIKHKVLTPEQYGFRKSSSTSLACFNLIKQITECISSKKSTASLFLDMSKAFDHVNHRILLQKMHTYGIRGKAYDWFKSYLDNREQSVEITSIDHSQGKPIKKAFTSDYRINNNGVPQGSILGPLLFLLYINDLPKVTNDKFILFADDSTLVIEAEQEASLKDKIEASLARVNQWLSENCLQINVNKTKIIHYKTQRANPAPLNVTFNNENVDQTEETIFLGIRVDAFLNWKPHVKSVCDKLDRFVYALRRLTLTVSKKAAIIAYYGYAHSVLQYALIIWGNSINVEDALKAQKKCIRAICGVPVFESCKPLFKELKILPLTCMYIMEICLFVKSNPILFKLQSDISNRPTRYEHKLSLPWYRLQYCRRNVFCMCVIIYNKLPTTFKELTYSKFKRAIFKWLLDKCFYKIDDYLNYNENGHQY